MEGSSDEAKFVPAVLGFGLGDSQKNPIELQSQLLKGWLYRGLFRGLQHGLLRGMLGV